MEFAIHTLLYRTAHRQRSAMRPYLRRLGLGPGQPRLLVSLERDGPSSQKRLADSLEMDPSAVCRMLDTLEKGGFVSRGVDRNDRRADTIAITDKGRRALEAWQQVGRQIDRQMLQGFTDEEVKQLAEYLERLRVNLQPQE